MDCIWWMLVWYLITIVREDSCEVSEMIQSSSCEGIWVRKKWEEVITCEKEENKI